jgi:NAD(P)-dependent dehydrogenase (short-subunit alcohol dehydrogenase family)
MALSAKPDRDSRPLSGRHALVTGGGRGIGAAIADTLATLGCAVSLLGRTPGPLASQAKAIAERHGVKTAMAAADVADPASVDAAFAAARAALGPIAILVNNAGIALAAPIAKIKLEDWRRTLDVDLTGPFLCARAALPDMIAAKWGRIVTVASTAGLKAYPYVAPYVAAKHGVIGLTRALALELAKTGVTVNAVCPGYTETEIVEDAVKNIVAKTGRSVEEARAELVKSNPQGRMIRPAEVAAAVAYLCGDEAGSLTGQALAVAGGEVM